MCEFLSWYEDLSGQVHFLTDADLKGQMTYGPPIERLLTPAALAEYERIRQPAWAEYERIQQPAWAEYQRIEQQAWAEYQRIEQQAFWSLFANPENRIPAWR